MNRTILAATAVAILAAGGAQAADTLAKIKAAGLASGFAGVTGAGFAGVLATGAGAGAGVVGFAAGGVAGLAGATAGAGGVTGFAGAGAASSPTVTQIMNSANARPRQAR